MVWFVMNLKSGTTTPAKKNKIKALISKLPDCELIFTEYVGHATEIAQKAVLQEIGRAHV